MKKGIIATSIYASLVFSGCSSGAKDELDSVPKTGILSAYPNPSMVLEDIVFDASESSAGNRNYYFDFDGDGVYDRVSSSPIARHRFESAGDYKARLMIGEDTRKYTPVTCSVAVGFGDEYDSADSFYRFSEAVLLGMGYSCIPDKKIQLFDPVSERMVNFSLLGAESPNGGEAFFVIYQDNLSIKQNSCIQNRLSEGLDEPHLYLGEPRHSPAFVREQILNMIEPIIPSSNG